MNTNISGVRRFSEILVFNCLCASDISIASAMEEYVRPKKRNCLFPVMV